MRTNVNTQHGENFNLKDMLKMGKNLSFRDRVNYFSIFLDGTKQGQQNLYMRPVLSRADREVEIIDPFSSERRKMLMFGSNNYLGLANHHYVKLQVQKAINEFGVGIGGPPLLNGYTLLHRQLEERLSTFKHAEDTLIFSTGYGANLGLITALVNGNDRVIFDELSHASFYDGLRMAEVKSVRFCHNNLGELAEQINHKTSGDTFVGVEGVYSMDGDLAPLNKIVPLCKKSGAILILDDAHGTGVMGKSGSGTAEYFGVDGLVDITMGTFSKTFGVVGGFVSASKSIIDYLRFFSRSYMFSASLPPMVIAAVLAGLDIIEQEPELLQQLHDNVKYTAKGLCRLGHIVNPQAAIIALRVPETMNIRKAAYQFHKAGIFVNSIEYPAVQVDQQRFRISIMATHTKADIDRLLECIEDVWAHCNQNNSKILSATA